MGPEYETNARGSTLGSVSNRVASESSRLAWWGQAIRPDRDTTSLTLSESEQGRLAAHRNLISLAGS